ncbi:rhamnogalacturonan acetylesterase [Streptomyces sp. NPDC102282]|uniref:rhamnogalacturonan acetylesterase n=1 Tax=Streptomyces sp. NPDC102282 TaxID=3366154 RepID=UPI0037FDCE09
MPSSAPRPRRAARGTALLSAALGFATLLGSPAQAHSPSVQGQAVPSECSGTSPVVCHFDVPPGNYNVSALLGGSAPGSTSVLVEARRTMLAETQTQAGRHALRSFTVNVREPEGQPTDPTGTPGLDIRFEGAAPQLSGLKVTPAGRTPQILLAGDSTVCDQWYVPYAGWGQELTQFLRRGISVANYADSGESTQSFLDNPVLFDALEARIRRGDLVLIQLAHNDKTTTAAVYRANLTAMAERVTAKGGQPVFVTPIVRRRFNSDGTLNSVALHVTGQANLPVEMRSLAQELDVPLVDLTAMSQELVERLGTLESRDLYLTDVNGDNTHTSVYGATRYAELVLGDLKTQRLVPSRLIR